MVAEQKLAGWAGRKWRVSLSKVSNNEVVNGNDG
jgi:hypothetical protein